MRTFLPARACRAQVDGDLSVNSRATISDGNLTIDRLDRHDAGRYECVVTNAVASAVASTLLVVERKLARRPVSLPVESNHPRTCYRRAGRPAIFRSPFPSWSRAE